MTLSFKVTWLICKSTNKDITDKDPNKSNTEGLRTPFQNSEPPLFVPACPPSPLHLFWSYFGTEIISLYLKITEPHGVCSVSPTASLCSRDGDGCLLERTEAERLRVRPGYPQVRDVSVLRGIQFVVGYIDVLARHVEYRCC